MAFDSDEMISFKGKMISKGVVFHKVKSLGWSTRLFSDLRDEEIIQVLEQRKTPVQMGKNPATTFDPKQVVDLNGDEGSVPEIMGGRGSSVEDGPMPEGAPVSESGVVVTSIAPSTLAAKALAAVSTEKHLRPVDPTRPQPQPPLVHNPLPPPIQPPIQPKAINIKPPRTDRAKLQSMLEAAYALAQNEPTHSTAKTLIVANGLERPFQALHTELYAKLFGRLDTTPDSKCRGGIVLDIEIEADNGYIHIITTAGTITITGQQIAHRGADV